LGGEVIRGSSTYTGARALRDYYQALVHEGISPAITPDGPRGPAWKFKPGAILLSQLSQRPIIPMAYAASRALKIKWSSNCSGCMARPKPCSIDRVSKPQEYKRLACFPDNLCENSTVG